MPPKNKLKNGFYFFAIDYREDQEGLGREMPRNIAELMTIAGPAWKALPEHKKREYNNQAKELNGRRDKMDCTGRLIKEVEQEQREKKEYAESKIRYISGFVRSLGTIDAIRMEKFYIISFNILCKTTCDMYLPVEVGLVEFSILEGVTKTYHTFIDPGEIPIGYKFQCKEKSERTHKIPWLGFELGEKDYTKIIESIIDMIDPHKNLSHYPPIYSLTDEIEQNQDLLDMFKNHTDRCVSFTVFDFAQLFYELHSYVKTDMISDGLIRDYLNNDVYTFHEKTSCKWHWDNDCVRHCSLGIAKRSCYILFDHLCSSYDVTLVLSRHMPLFDAKSGSQISSSAASVHSNSSFYESFPPSGRSTVLQGMEPRSNTSQPRLYSSNSQDSRTSYFTPSASPQYRSGPSNSGYEGRRTGWNCNTEPRKQSFSEAAAANNNDSSNAFHMRSVDFPGIGRGHGGARPKQMRPDPAPADPRTCSRNSDVSNGSYQQSGYSGMGYGRGRY